jgi:hypothetical protein
LKNSGLPCAFLVDEEANISLRQRLTKRIAGKLTPNGIGVLTLTRVAASAHVRRHKRRAGDGHESSY